MNAKNLAQKALEQGNGILRLIPAWVPRSFCRPGRRLRLHPDDYYKLGLSRGGIDERWLSSTTKADNGPGTPEDEGLSYIAVNDTERVLLGEAIEELKADIVGVELWENHGGMPVYSKFFDNLGPLPHHVHHGDEHAARVGQKGKPEMYFYPSQMNNHGGEFPFTFFGLNPETTRDELYAALRAFPEGDNKLLSLSRSYKLDYDTGWDVPTGVLHAPGSLCTYEPQFASDVYAMYQSVLYFDHAVPEDLLWKNCPPEERGNIDYLIEVLDWALNTDPDFHRNRFMAPISALPTEESVPAGFIDEWICYKSPAVSAKRLTVLPRKTVTIKDHRAYGLICVQGHGQISASSSRYDIESPTLIRFGQLTNDEFFITDACAKQGVTFYNPSATEPIVILRHFAGGME